MDVDEDMSGLQIEDLGEYFLQTDVNENWKGFSLGYTDEDQQAQVDQLDSIGAINSNRSADTTNWTAGDTSMQYLMSPPLASVSDMLKYGDGLGVGMGFGSPTKDFATSFRTDWAPESAKSDVAMMSLTAREDVELTSFSLDQHETSTTCVVPDLRVSTFVTPRGEKVKTAASKLQSTQCQNLPNRGDDDDDANYCGEANTLKRVCSTIGSESANGASPPMPDDDRGSRKKSREKMRRQEVNVKFDKLVDLLGLSNRVRKSAILQEAVSTITSLKRERDELRRDRDRLQQEVSKLATCLQFSQLGSVAAAMTQQPNQQLSHTSPSVEHLDQQQQQQQHHGRQDVAVSSALQTVHTHPPNVSCYPGANCFPLSSTLSDISSRLGPHSSSALPVSGQVAIAPKCLKPTPSTSAYTPIAPDVNMK
uniref:BHLH domain-containing protein n=1 Tax=Hyaloperonospora arabidopsidis (strain Emoy2) TaxID=559515 RepID=M4BFC4_HYAAE